MIEFGIGVYLILFGWIQSTENLRSFIYYKAVPFGMGVFLAMKSAKILGWL